MVNVKIKIGMLAMGLSTIGTPDSTPVTLFKKRPVGIAPLATE
jgi:hypothetical protein